MFIIFFKVVPRKNNNTSVKHILSKLNAGSLTRNQEGSNINEIKMRNNKNCKIDTICKIVPDPGRTVETNKLNNRINKIVISEIENLADNFKGFFNYLTLFSL
ncbi:MAG: hypothetical protein IPL53_22925 [Ignavibacteria bacterium]|nr:hypothetical protein [Ignavibacteria bacterium]